MIQRKLFARLALFVGLLLTIPVTSAPSVADQLPPILKTTTAGPVTALFGGGGDTETPLEFRITHLWFRFAGDDRDYPFKPQGELDFSDGRFEIFSPDGRRVVLKQDRFGPYHIVIVDRLKDYLTGRAMPSDVVGRPPRAGQVAAVHENARWLSAEELEYRLVCCGEPETKVHKVHFWGYQPKSTLDLVTDYRPGIRDRLNDLPIGSDDLVLVAKEFLTLADAAQDEPGDWYPGNVAQGAEPREYVPSDAELLAAELGEWLVQSIQRVGSAEAKGRLAAAGVVLDGITYKRFAFRHADVMGSGRYFYASAPERVRVRLSQEDGMNDTVVGSAFFESPKSAVDQIREMLRAKDWPRLTRYYDLTGTDIDPTDLNSGAFFWREDRPEIAHPGGFWRYKHPFPPSFRYQMAEPETDAGIVTVHLMIEIDQGAGSPTQAGFQTFRLRRSDNGYQVLPD